jgi:sugar transferase (PEP-CTERM/EpsH1 system associated)
MHILFIAPRLPVPADTGGKIRTLNILKQLALHAKIHLACFSFDPKDQEFALGLKKDGIKVTLIPGKELSFVDKIMRVLTGPEPVSVSKYYCDEMESVLTELHQTNEFDAVHIDHLHMAHYRDCFDRSPCVLDEHNVEYKILDRCANVESSMLKRFIFKGQARKMKKFEAENVKKFSAYLAVSDEDKNLLVELGADSACGHVIANGVDTEYFQGSGGRGQGSEEEEAVVFTGSMDWLPNDDAALYFCKDILPLVWKKNPKVKFYVVGKGPSSALKDCARFDGRIIVTGRVDDVRVYVERSKVFVVPLRIGGGTRLKILEAMSMRKAVVSTSIGAEGIACRDGHDIVMADTPEDFARKVLDLLGAPSSLERISSAGCALVKEQYDWNIIGRTLWKAYEKYKT